MTLRLDTPRLAIRNWEERDRDLFFHINSDDRVMRFFPFRRNRGEADALLDRLRSEIEERGFGLAALERLEDGRCIGFAGLRPDSVAPARPPDTIEIGWRLAPEFWGRGYATEAAEAFLRLGFTTLGLDEIVSFAVWSNEPSLAVMRRLGMRREPDADFDHPRVPDSHPHLRRHHFYALSREDWQRRRKD